MLHLYKENNLIDISFINFASTQVLSNGTLRVTYTLSKSNMEQLRAVSQNLIDLLDKMEEEE